MHTKKIAINELGGSQWTGGITYRVNLLKALKVHPSFDFKNVFLIVSKKSDAEKMPIPENQVLELPKTKGRIDKLWCSFLKKYFNYDVLMSRIVKENNIDVIFPSYLKSGKAKSIYWMPDFQFMHLPNFFTKQAIKSFNIKLPNYFNLADSVVLSSQDAKNDFEKFSPEFLNKTRVMRFVAHVPENVYKQSVDDISTVYNIPKKYIYMPNQFWAHKNHMVVFKALNILKERGITPFLVLTGNPVDVRNPSYLAGILEEISKLGIRNQIAILGLIPHALVYSLMRHADFVINPSFFEGWSTTVEECKSIGKKMILSNLNVHQEQKPPNSVYFDPNNAEQLADKIEDYWTNTVTPIDLDLEHQARESIEMRSIEFAEQFLNIINE